MSRAPKFCLCCDRRLDQETDEFLGNMGELAFYNCTCGGTYTVKREIVWEDDEESEPQDETK